MISRMGIVRVMTYRMNAPFEAVHASMGKAMLAVGLVDVDVAANPVTGTSERSIRRNRWAAQVSAGVRPESPATTLVDITVDMAGDKHYDVVDEILAATGLPIDDLGVGSALERLGKMGRFFGAAEAKALTRVINVDERVVELAQGVYDGAQGMLVLTTTRLFFFDKRIKGQRIESFDLPAITSIGQASSLGGETINISISGRSAEIKQVAHGRSDVFIRAFRQTQAASTQSAGLHQSAPSSSPAPQQSDIPDQLRKLAELHAGGILTDDEFATKKAELLSRM